MGARLLIFLGILSINNAIAQINTEVKIAAISNSAISHKMEQAVTAMINEINNAYDNNVAPKNPDKLLVDAKGFESILSLWEVSHFKITQMQLTLDGLNLQKGGYQIRNIPVYFKEESDENQEREIAFTFDKNGKMIDCFLCLEFNTYNSLLNNHNSVTELRRREIILDFLEKFRTAYNTKDSNLIKQVFSDNALIIVGKIVKELSKPDNLMRGSFPKEKVEYVRLSKKEYLSNLSKAFKANQFIKIDFDSIEIVQSKRYAEVYGVTLWQSWNSTRYSDKGWLFLMIDFKNEDNPLIHVRTWQPGYLNGQVLSKDSVFHLGDFNLEKD